jgi:hypothetical protein
VFRFQSPGMVFLFALLDGNMLLLDFNLSLEPVLAESVVNGKYVRWHDGHFVGVEVFDSHILVHDNGASTSLCHLEQVVLDATTTFFHLISYPGMSIFDGRWDQTHDRLGSADEEDEDYEHRSLDEILQDEEAENQTEVPGILAQAFASLMDDNHGGGPSQPPSEPPSQFPQFPSQSQGIHGRRGNIEGGLTSTSDFQSLFQSCGEQANISLSGAASDNSKGRSNIMDRTREITNMVNARHRVMLRE